MIPIIVKLILDLSQLHKIRPVYYLVTRSFESEFICYTVVTQAETFAFIPEGRLLRS